MKILVVEDNRWLQVLYESELAEEGYEVFVAGTGAEALERLESLEPDLITMDLGLPDARGANILTEIKEKLPDVPVIVLTAYDKIDEVARLLADAILIKSSDLGNLKQEIAGLISKPRARKRALPRQINIA